MAVVMVVVSGGDRESCHLQVMLRQAARAPMAAPPFPMRKKPTSKLPHSRVRGPHLGPSTPAQGYDLSLLSRPEAILLLDKLPPGFQGPLLEKYALP